ncbi:MAG: hypothetical protein RUMPE_00937 [Eubacteriales bacterium SKADARSKE-1]|nr:hypothetical protein [Eubacteriales bacterium SKADARSKE-1]
MNQAGLMLIAVSISLAVLPLLVPVIYIPYVFTGLAVKFSVYSYGRLAI